MNLEINLDEMAKDIARRALDEATYEGKTLREWIDLIKAYSEAKDDLISKSALVETLSQIEFPEAKSAYGRSVMESVKDLYESILQLILNFPAGPGGDPHDP